jgi:hypothetical protein
MARYLIRRSRKTYPATGRARGSKVRYAVVYEQPPSNWAATVAPSMEAASIRGGSYLNGGGEHASGHTRQASNGHSR